MGEQKKQTVKERLIVFLESIDVNKSEFGRRIGVSSSYISAMRRSIQPDKLELISSEFPQLNIDWLLTGNGDMLLDDSRRSDAKELGGVFLVGDGDSEVSLVDFVPVAAQASFVESLMSGSDDEEKHPVVLSSSERAEINKYKVFEIEGDSMYPTLKGGALVLAKKLPEGLWHYAEGVVVAVYSEYVVVKRIVKNDLLNNNVLVLGSDNTKYGSMVVPLADLRALYKAKRIISSDIV